MNCHFPRGTSVSCRFRSSPPTLGDKYTYSSSSIFCVCLLFSVLCPSWQINLLCGEKLFFRCPEPILITMFLSNICNALMSDDMGGSHKCLFTEHSEPMTDQCADTTNIQLHKTMNFLVLVQ